VIDFGEVTTGRGTEMVLPIWVRLCSAVDNPSFPFEIVR
jgi:hypothetical protein